MAAEAFAPPQVSTCSKTQKNYCKHIFVELGWMKGRCDVSMRLVSILACDVVDGCVS